jgi:hypothetical protein
MSGSRTLTDRTLTQSGLPRMDRTDVVNRFRGRVTECIDRIAA